MLYFKIPLVQKPLEQMLLEQKSACRRQSKQTKSSLDPTLYFREKKRIESTPLQEVGLFFGRHDNQQNNTQHNYNKTMFLSLNQVY